MERTLMPESNTVDEYKSASWKEMLDISKWAFKFLYSLSPTTVTIFFVFSIVNNIRDIINSYIFAKILDIIIGIANSPEPNIAKLYPYIGGLLAYNLISTLISYFYRYSSFSLRVTSSPKITQALYKKIKELEIQTIENAEITNKLYRANGHLNDILAYFHNITDIFSSMFNFIVSAVLVFHVIPFLLPLMILVSLPRVLVDKKYRKLVYKFQFENTEAMRKASANANDLTQPRTLQEIFINKAYGFFDDKYSKFYTWFNTERLNIQRSWYKGSYSSLFIGDVGLLFANVLIFAKLIAKQSTIGDSTFQIRAVANVKNSIFDLVISINDLSEMSIKMKDTFELFNAKPAFKEGSIYFNRLEKGPSIHFKNVSFKYPSSADFVIKDLDLKIKPGEKVAIVGHNGAGKTTLVRMLCRMYPTTLGELRVNGVNINDLNSQSWYQNVGVLFQDYNTYPQFNVRENIQIGDPTIPLDENKVIEAAANADALSFINEFPNKFDQVLSERFKGGIRPSTGQWQKIAIARFFYRDAPLVIFDEPTASIDAVSEYKIFNKIYQFFKSKTVIIISHRFSTVRNADRIIMMEKGRIIESGTHDELMELNGNYARSFLLQAEGYQTAGATLPQEIKVK
jgi:ATP-binding cassette subfamily B protein